jgi:hypothetical protein
MAEPLSKLCRTLTSAQRRQGLVWSYELGHPSSRAQAVLLARTLGIMPPAKVDGRQWNVTADMDACLGVGRTDGLRYSARSQHRWLFDVPLPEGSVRAWLFAGDTAGFFHVPSVTGSLFNVGGWAPVPPAEVM